MKQMDEVLARLNRNPEALQDLKDYAENPDDTVKVQLRGRD